ncbi:helix-turn-helix domain-containing protein [Mariniblastus sp.]|nr:helix-turn-helix domain-containing protein [Mariniblastus sp.]
MSKDIINSEIYTLAEAAAYLKVSVRTLWQLAKDGKIPHRRVGKQYRFVYSVLLAWAKGEQVTNS